MHSAALLALEPLLNRGSDEWGGVAAVAFDLADGRGRHIGEVLARHHEERLDLGRQPAVRERHLELVLEVRVDADAANDDARLFAAAEVDKQAVQHLDSHVLETGATDVLLDHPEPFLAREAGALLLAGRRHGDDQAVVQL